MLKVGDPMEYTALYREWRPDTFDEVVGQDHVIRILKNQTNSGRISHAYLFCGPRGTGKTSTAKIFGKAINCTDPQDGNPCGVCRVCTTIDSENNMDVIEIDAASNTGVDHIREIRDKIKYPPSVGRYRVYIIDEVHMLSTSAFNAFLKTLEEPPDHIVFILATTEAHKLPSTVLSRCQRYDFRRITLKVIVDRLKTIAKRMGIEVEDEALDTIARWSEGGMRDSISLFDQCISFCGTSIKESDVLAILGTAGNEFLFDVVNNIMKGDISSLLIQIDRLVEEGKDLSVFLKDLINHLRNLLIVDICGDDPSGLLDVSQSTLEEYRRQASNMNQSRLVRSIEILSELDAEIKWNTRPRIMVEMAMVRICRPQDGNSIEDLIDRIAILEKQVSEGIPIARVSDINLSDARRTDEDIAEIIQESTSKKLGFRDLDEIKPSKDEPAEKDKEEHQGKAQKAGKQEEAKKIAKDTNAQEATIEKIDIEEVWDSLLKKIRRERMAIFPLLRSTKLQLDSRNKNIVNLVFPSQQEFYVAAIEKEDNSQYIEGLLLESTGQKFKLKCYTEDNVPNSISKDNILEITDEEAPSEEEEKEDIVQKAIDIFGKEYVEVIDD